jgi:hypothetical protein
MLLAARSSWARMPGANWAHVLASSRWWMDSDNAWVRCHTVSERKSVMPEYGDTTPKPCHPRFASVIMAPRGGTA